MSCSSSTTSRLAAGPRRELAKPEFRHALLVEVPARSSRALRWAFLRGIGDLDRIAFTAMLRAERLSSG
jgi:hypothetical protein